MAALLSHVFSWQSVFFCCLWLTWIIALSKRNKIKKNVYTMSTPRSTCRDLGIVSLRADIVTVSRLETRCLLRAVIPKPTIASLLLCLFSIAIHVFRKKNNTKWKYFPAATLSGGGEAPGAQCKKAFFWTLKVPADGRIRSEWTAACRHQAQAEHSRRDKRLSIGSHSEQTCINSCCTLPLLHC